MAPSRPRSLRPSGLQRVSSRPLLLLAAGLVWGLGLAGCGPKISSRYDLPYDLRFGASTTLDAFLPEDGEDGHPVMFLVHGGAWEQESKAELDSLAGRWAQAGYLAVSVNYRLGEQGRFPRAVQDVHCALSWVRAHAAELGGDPGRVGAFGYSAGGHLVSLLAVAADDPDFAPDCRLPPTGPPRAVISGAGVQDLRQLGWVPQVRNFLGGSPEERPEIYDQASPLERVRAGAPAFLFVHGDQDAYVPADQSRRMHARLTGLGTRSELLLLHGGGHILNPGGSVGELSWKEFSVEAPEAWPAMADFMDRELRR